ncbi:MAG: glutathione S-transferase family protein [Burkholderiales bacterium]
MKLYYHPASTTSRPVVLFAAESDIPLDLEVVDLFTGEQYKPPFESVNPNHLVPVLDDDGFRITESSAILKYLADKIGSPLYPKELHRRARVNERMDWINTQLARDLCYGFVYPQILPNHKRRSPEAHESTLEWGKQRAQSWMKVLNDHILGANNAYLCGNDITIADYFGASFVALAELTGTDFTTYPNVNQWLARMKALKHWDSVYSVIAGFGASLKGQPLVAL